jgi:hypothetical protein
VDQKRGLAKRGNARRGRETHAVGAMVQEKQYLHALLEELAILI